MESTALFMSKDLQAVLRRHREGVSELVNGIPASQFVIMDRQKLTEKIAGDATLMPLKLDTAMMLFRVHEGMIEILPENDSHGSEATAKRKMGIQFEIEIPLLRDGWLLESKPNTIFRTRPTIILERGCLRPMIGLLDKIDSDDVEKVRNNSFVLIRKFVFKFNDEINSYNIQLRRLVAREVDNRHERLETISNLRKVLFGTCKGHGDSSHRPCMQCE